MGVLKLHAKKIRQVEKKMQFCMQDTSVMHMLRATISHTNDWNEYTFNSFLV